jgi:hypothetical protein
MDINNEQEMSKMEKLGLVMILNCAFMMLVGAMISIAPKGMTTEEFISISGTFISVLFLAWNSLIIAFLVVADATDIQHGVYDG